MTKVFEKSPAFFDTFTRKPSMQKTTHYCPGCGHGTLNKIMADHTGQDLSQLSSDTERDFFMGSEAAKEYGIIDDIVTRKQNS